MTHRTAFSGRVVRDRPDAMQAAELDVRELLASQPVLAVTTGFVCHGPDMATEIRNAIAQDIEINFSRMKHANRKIHGNFRSVAHCY
jgi:phosphopantothenate synthetase